MTETIHIPEEVVEAMTAARRKYIATIEADTRIGELTDGEHADMSADEARAALSAWVECGMAKTGFGYPFAEDRPDNWIADSNLTKDNATDFSDTFPVLIIKTTEAT